MTKYNYSKTKTISWHKVEKFYSDQINEGFNFQPMLELVKYIGSSKLSERLYPSISLHKLRISIYEEIDHQKETLHLEYNLNSETWFFNYFSKPFVDAEFSRKYEKKLGIEKFQNFIKDLNW